MLGFAEARQVGVDGGGHGTVVAEVDLDLAEVLALLQQMGGVGMAERVNVRLFFDGAGMESQSEGALQSGAGHRFGGCACAHAAVALGGKEQGRMVMRSPLFT